MNVFFHRLAARELTEARLRYARFGPPTEDIFLRAVRAAVLRIETNPNSGSPYRGPYRWVRTKKYPYILYYAPLDPTEVEVFAFSHAHRRPGYWLRRVDRP